MQHRIIPMAVVIAFFSFSAQASEEACVENFHVIGHNIRVAYVVGDLQNTAAYQSAQINDLPLSQTYCSIPPSKFHLAVYYIPTLNEKRGYPGATSDEILVTNEEFNLDTGDYLGFNLSSDGDGKLKVLYSRPKKNQFNQAATIVRKSIP